MIPEHNLSASKYATGEAALATGIYRVIHGEHRLPAEVTVLRGQQFPRCAKCTGAVQFELLRLVEGPSAGTIKLHELPVLDDDERDESSIAS